MRASLALSVLLACSSCAVAPGKDERDVIAAVQALFDGMKERDVQALRALLSDGAVFASVRMSAGRAVTRSSTATEFLASIGRGGDRLLERMFEPVVDVRGDFAFAQVDYDFHRGDAYSHYGVDQFLLVREQGRWRIACITYSVVPGGDASPFGGV